MTTQGSKVIVKKAWFLALPLLGLTLAGIGDSSVLSAQDAEQAGTGRYYKGWLESDVAYIISDEEKEIFRSLTSDEERANFIELFWRRRDPTPVTADNEFKEEHYRRIAYANDRFSAGIPGWRTDRGRVYITFGPPAEIESNPTGTVILDNRTAAIQSSPPRQVRTFPFEVWRYLYIEGIGSEVTIEFVDKTGSGLYKLSTDEEDKNVFAYKDSASDVASLTRSDLFRPENDRQFNRTEIMAGIYTPPKVEFTDLQEVVSSRIHYDQIPFLLDTGLIRVTESSFQVPVTLKLAAHDLEFREANGIYATSVNLLIQVTNIQKRVVLAAEDTLRFHGRNLENLSEGNLLYQKKLLLPPGRFALDVVLKDTNSEKIGSSQRLVVIPQPSESLSLSSLILADVMRPIEDGESLEDPFAIGAHKVVPNVANRFEKSEQLGLFFQIYGLSLDQDSLKPSVELEVFFKQKDKVILGLADDLGRFGVLRGNVASVTMSMPLDKFPEGGCDLEVVVADNISGDSVRSETSFTILPVGARRN